MFDPKHLTHAECEELLDIAKDYRERGKPETALWLIDLIDRVRPTKFLDHA